jgi:glutathione S-transferase
MVLSGDRRLSTGCRVRTARNPLGFSFQAIPVDLAARDQNATDNLTRIPQGLVPTLVIDAITLTQSRAIPEYLDNTRDAGCQPKDAPGKAPVRGPVQSLFLTSLNGCPFSRRCFLTGQDRQDAFAEPPVPW